MTGTIDIEYTTATNHRHRVVYEHDIEALDAHGELGNELRDIVCGQSQDSEE